jgi:hypothetical protein
VRESGGLMPEPFSFASYLVRLRLKPDMLPEYLWATLNSAYGKYRLINSAKQAVSMANVSPTDLGAHYRTTPSAGASRKVRAAYQRNRGAAS